MNVRALIVDDEEKIVRKAGEVVRSLDHDFHIAGDLQTARKCLRRHRYDYLILDMNLPVAPGRLTGRRENGRNFIASLRKSPDHAKLPIVVVTGHDKGESDFILSVMKAGGFEHTTYVQKPVDGDKLDEAIQGILECNSTQSPSNDKPSTPQRFDAQKRELVIYPDRVTLCGVKVWTDHANPHMRQMLTFLAERTKYGFVRLPGPTLVKRLNRNPSNPLGPLVKRFRETCREKMATCLGLDCGMYDVIGPVRGGGYHLTEHLSVKIQDGCNDSVQKTQGDEPVHGFKPNERQRWILDQVAHGAQLRQKDVIRKFQGVCSASTVKRDLKGLRQRNLLRTESQSGYFKN